MLDYRGSGMSVMEMSHRSKEFIGIAEKAEADLIELLGVPADYQVLFLQGGATRSSRRCRSICSATASRRTTSTRVPGRPGRSGGGAFCRVNVVGEYRGASFTGSRRDRMAADPNAAYLHICRTRRSAACSFHDIPAVGDVPLVADMSSHLLSRPIDVTRFGAHLRRRAEEHRSRRPRRRDRPQGPPRTRAAPDTPSMLDYAVHADSGLDVEHAADLRLVPRRARVRVDEAPGRARRDRAINARKAAKLYGRSTTATSTVPRSRDAAGR